MPGFPGNADNPDDGVITLPTVFKIGVWGMPWWEEVLLGVAAAAPATAALTLALIQQGDGPPQGYQASQRGKGDVRDTGVTQSAQQMVSSGGAKDICTALDLLLSAAKASGNTALQLKIKATMKGFGCRPSRQSR
jgi:hypothetical protein